MAEKEQKRLYEHFEKLAIDGETDIIRANAKKYAKDILDSGFAHFKNKPISKEEVKEEFKPKAKVK